jgi:virginiamycin B lyase
MPRSKSFVSLRWAAAGLMPLALALPGRAISFTDFGLPTKGLLGSIATGPDGNIWVTDSLFNAVIQMTTAGVPLQRFTVFNMPLFPVRGMVAGPDGNLWLTVENGSDSAIARLTLQGGVTYFPVSHPNAGLCDLTVGPDGNLWFTDAFDPHIGRVSLTGEIVEFPVSKTTTGITVGPDGNLWFCEGDSIGRMSPQGVLQEFPIPWSSPGARHIVSGPDGNLWFTDTSGRIGRVTTSGAFTSFPVPGSFGPFGLVAGPDGKLWFTTGSGQQIGSITMRGDIAMYVASTQSPVVEITAGPDGDLWFTETGNPGFARVGRATLGLDAPLGS